MKRLFGVTSAEFEAMQLKADNVFCRRCGIVDDRIERMEHVGLILMSIFDESNQVWHLYRCAACGHTAGSQAYPELHATQADSVGIEVAYEDGIPHRPEGGRT